MEKEKIKNWLKEPFNLALLGVLIFAVGIRLYYFSFTLGQGLWWDEAAYGSLAKNIMHGGIWDATDLIIGEKGIRPPLFPLIWGFLVSIGFGESAVRFLLEFVPSVIAVFFVYLIGREFYGKKVGLISTAIFSVLWIHLFYTGRLLTNVPALSLLFPSIYLFSKALKTENGINGKYFAFSLILAALATIVRYPVGLIFFVYLGFLILTLRTDLLKEKKFWISGIFGMIPLWIFFLINYVRVGNIFPALLGSDYVQVVNEKIGFYVLNFIPTYLTTTFFVTFLIGLVIVVLELFLGYDQIRKSQKLRGHLLLLLLFIAVYGYFVFYLRGAEDRWLMPASLALVIFSGYGMGKIQDFLKKYGKKFSSLIVILLLVWGAYAQINFANDLIENRSTSFLQLRQGFEWIKENSAEDSKILGAGIQAYSIYYAERGYVSFTSNESDTEELAKETDYLVLHGFTKPPEFVERYVQENQDKWALANVFFFDEAKTQPAFIVYRKI